MLNKLYALYLLKKSMDYSQTCKDIYFGGEKKNYQILVSLTPFFKVTGSQRMLKKALSPPYLLNG